jgi:thiosulfate reductase cytochrome b subunit
MDSTALLLPRIKFGFTISFIIFSAFTIGLAPWLTVLEALHLRTGRPVHQTLFEFWSKSFGVAFGLCVVSGVHRLRRDLVGRLSARICDADVGVLHPGHHHAAGTDSAWRRVPVPR